MDPSRRGEERQRVRWPTVLLSSATDGGLPLVLARFVRGLSTHQDSGCLRRLRTARNCSQVSPCAGRLPSGCGPNADRPFDEPTTSTARRVAAATWMMSSTTVASRAYAVVPARRSRWSRGGASRPSSAPAAGSARHRADASRRDRAARSPDPQPASCRRSFRRGFLSCSCGSEHSTPLVSSAGPAASFGLRWSRCPCRSLRTKSWPRRCSSRSSSLSLICRASLDERKALASAKTTLGLDRRHHPNDVLDATGRCPREPV